MARRNVLLLCSLLIFSSQALVQEQPPASPPTQPEKPAQLLRVVVKTIQWHPRPGDLAIFSEEEERYVLHLHPPLPAMEKNVKEGRSQLLAFPYPYEAVLQWRLMNLFVQQIVLITEGYDRSQEKELRPKRLDLFVWDFPGQSFAAEITPGVVKEGATIALDEKLKYSFDLKNDVVSLENSPPHRLDAGEADFIKRFLGVIAIYVHESIEWFEARARERQEQKAPPSPKKEERKREVT